jgi:hypothetical protein
MRFTTHKEILKQIKKACLLSRNIHLSDTDIYIDSLTARLILQLKDRIKSEELREYYNRMLLKSYTINQLIQVAKNMT